MARGKAKQAAADAQQHRPMTRQRTLFSHFTRANSQADAKETNGEQEVSSLVRDSTMSDADEIEVTPSSPTLLPVLDAPVQEKSSASVVKSTRAKNSQPKPVNQSQSTTSKNIHPLFAKTTNAVEPPHPVSIATPASQVIDADRLSSPPTTHISLPSSPVGATRHDPIIIIESSPVKGTAAPQKLAKPKPRLSSNQWSVPTRTVHAKGDQSRFVAPPLALPLAERNKPLVSKTTSPSHSPVWAIAVQLAATVNCLPTDKREHPAISRFLVPDAYTADIAHNQADWAHMFRPKQAAEVLGNETQAVYLRDWLTALALRFVNPENGPTVGKKASSQKQPPKKRVLRSFDKKKGRKRRKLHSDEEDNNWIVADDFEEEPPVADLDDDSELAPSLDHLQIKRENTAVSYYPDFSQWLTNSILLCGPHGSGKTAAVYACAAELGWEVFEVYPGIGRRNGAAVDALIGDVGKNHLVKKGKTDDSGQLRTPSAFDLLGRKATNEKATVQTTQEPTVNQSLILLEEVDILFKDDVNFWPTMANIIKECRRPVVFTCNDPTLIPQTDFPLQTILNFTSCPIPLASAYLRVLSATSPHFATLTDAHAENLYTNSSCGFAIDFDNPDAPLHPFSITAPAPDLRKAINQLQWLSCRASHHQNTSEESKSIIGDEESFAPALIHAELASFVDATMTRNAYDSPWALTFGNDVEPDEEQGHISLSLPFRAMERPGPHSHYVMDSIMRAATVTSRELDATFSSLPVDRSVFQGHLLEAIQDSLSISGPLMPRPAILLDYEPYIRLIVAADDYHEQKDQERLNAIRDEQQQTHRARRLTRNSGYDAYVRNIDLTKEQRVALNHTEFSQL